jgi:hypothetical protein
MMIYDGGLRSGVDAAARPPVPGFPWPRPSVPVAFVEVMMMIMIVYYRLSKRTPLLTHVVCAGGARQGRRRGDAGGE